MKKFIAAAIILSFLTSVVPTQTFGSTALPEALLSGVHIDDVVLSRCGAQQISFSGTVNLDLDVPLNQVLVVSLDGQPVNYDLNGSLWVTALVPVEIGEHQLVAAITDIPALNHAPDKLDTEEISGMVNVDTMNFEVAACFPDDPTPTPDPTPTSTPTPTATPTQSPDNGGSTHNSNNGSNDEPQPTSAVKKGQVKGAHIKGTIIGAIPNKLVPSVVARIFKEVFGRAIQPFESTYWKLRARTDKVTERLLRSTMEWYKLRGTTVGK